MHLDDGRVVPNFIQQALRNEPLTVYGDGSQTRSFCYVDDLIDGIVRLLYSDEHYPVNIGNPNETSILNFAHLINQIVGNQAGIKFEPSQRLEGDPQRRQPDIQRAKDILGWQPQVKLEDGLRQTIEYFKYKMKLIG
jgi:dTDP-glucose 4,6-dehydratase